MVVLDYDGKSSMGSEMSQREPVLSAGKFWLEQASRAQGAGHSCLRAPPTQRLRSTSRGKSLVRTVKVPFVQIERRVAAGIASKG